MQAAGDLKLWTCKLGTIKLCCLWPRSWWVASKRERTPGLTAGKRVCFRRGLRAVTQVWSNKRPSRSNLFAVIPNHFYQHYLPFKIFFVYYLKGRYTDTYTHPEVREHWDPWSAVSFIKWKVSGCTKISMTFVGSWTINLIFIWGILQKQDCLYFIYNSSLH